MGGKVIPLWGIKMGDCGSDIRGEKKILIMREGVVSGHVGMVRYNKSNSLARWTASCLP